MEALRVRLFDLRIENGYKQEDLAKELNVTTSAYGFYEQGRNEPSLEMIVKIARFYQVSYDYLFGNTNIPHPPGHYTLSEKIILSEAQMQAVQRLINYPLLEEVGENPDLNADRLHKAWKFIKELLATNSTNEE